MEKRKSSPSAEALLSRILELEERHAHIKQGISKLMLSTNCSKPDYQRAFSHHPGIGRPSAFWRVNRVTHGIVKEPIAMNLTETRNRAAENLYGYTAAEAYGLTGAICISSDSRLFQEVKETLSQASKVKLKVKTGMNYTDRNSSASDYKEHFSGKNPMIDTHDETENRSGIHKILYSKCHDWMGRKGFSWPWKENKGEVESIYAKLGYFGWYQLNVIQAHKPVPHMRSSASAELDCQVCVDNYLGCITLVVTLVARTRRQAVWMADFESGAGLSEEDEELNMMMFLNKVEVDPCSFTEANESKRKKAIGVKWVYKTKLDENGEVQKFKARLDTVRLILNLATQRDWEVFQLDVKSAFLHGELKEEVFVQQPEDFKNSMMVEFDMSDLGRMRHFLGVEVIQSADGIFICTLLSKDEAGEEVDNTLYKQLVGSLMYLTVTRTDLMYGVSLISRFMARPKLSHWLAAKRILRYLKGTTDFSMFYKKGVSKESFVAYIGEWMMERVHLVLYL
ncbi:retrovirus-related pol polyprotein from transposon TNT 1-94 [Tanacetum coccineum]